MCMSHGIFSIEGYTQSAYFDKIDNIKKRIVQITSFKQCVR